MMDNPQYIPRFDDKAPPRPYRSGARERKVLCEGELLGGTAEVTDARQHQGPLDVREPEQMVKLHSPMVVYLHHRCPTEEVSSLISLQPMGKEMRNTRSERS